MNYISTEPCEYMLRVNKDDGKWSPEPVGKGSLSLQLQGKDLYKAIASLKVS